MIDSEGRPVRIGREIGRGGEGSVFEVEGASNLAAKVYHKLPLASDQVEKLETMVACWSEELELISAWPRSLLYKAAGKGVCGFLLPKIVDARQLHELYGFTNRRLHYPDAQWHHLVLAARNTAAAFATFHAAGIAVGDVNQGNLLVDRQMCVRMIDCDSTQITNRDKTFFCPVGTPHFTPPELQSMKLRDVYRTKNHDGFGLAVLIFHLLFIGRHPFAGRFRGAGDMTIEKAIAERRFAFSRHRDETLLDPPPASLSLADLPAGLAELFEQAFRADASQGDVRPSARLWVEQLEQLIIQRRTCRFDPTHVYYGQLHDCPWCRIEDQGGPSFFVPAEGVATFSSKRVEQLDERINLLQVAEFTELLPSKLELPSMPLLKKLESPPKPTRVDIAAFALAAAIGLCLVGIAWFPAWLLGIASLWASTGYLLGAAASRARRKTVEDFQGWLSRATSRLQELAQRVAIGHQQRQKSYDHAIEDFRLEIIRYRAEGDELRKILKEQGSLQKDEFLRKRLIRDSFRDVSGLTRAVVPMLESYGVDSAYDIDQINLDGVPNLSDAATIGLLQWKARVSQEFVHKPEHGVTLKDMKHAEEVATQRYKVTQARKVLMAATRLQNLAEAGRAGLESSLLPFDDLSSQWLGVAKQLRDFQSKRPTLERLANSSPATLICLAIGVPLVSLFFYAVFH
ncbi:MAG: hypothetical protein KDA57_14980 [Planctomycetales bacterium]|nr:hypothetical protein [Planctomycetales bacterium]